ncbi:type II secretion system protein GspM [Paraglaciecola sp. MB-3u-78]|jgi:general secretion pathway protein M|uniref:type II secretion system protein GspM n=1 Tax=Paraglaciecola sp. MB-3u-78 TaxID=2058332 RepID=UPI000C33ED31|nr:type II secretion system protein M [Paraglaciecola sp. MB-3u-78]PKG97947.1 type II secretion system protein M [Paraglaciecola sp. MB-3u-78]
MDKLKSTFLQLSDREQRLVIISAILVLVAIFYWGFWSPLNTSLERDQTAVKNQTELLDWVQKNANRAVQLRSSGVNKTSFSGSLPQAVNQSANSMKIAISRMQPQGDELQVWIDQAPFNDVLSWLQSLEKTGVSILDIDIAESDLPGQVKIRRLKLGKS